MSAAPDALSIAVLDPEQNKRLSVSVPAFMHEQVIKSPNLASVLVNGESAACFKSVELSFCVHINEL